VPLRTIERFSRIFRLIAGIQPDSLN
jgi:hypothetical protein